MEIRIFYILLIVIIISSCSPKTPTPTPVKPTNACVLTSTTISTGTQRFLYGTDGNLEWIKNRSDSTTVSDFSTSNFYKASSGYDMIQDHVFTGNNAGTAMDIFDGYPEESHLSQTEKGITRTRVYSYYYYYDSKKRIEKVSQQTENVIGDWEYDLFIYYNDQDNVSSITLKTTTGPNQTTTYTALGYDDKINPISSMKGARFLFSNWSYFETLFTSLSKNNCLGYTSDGWKSAFAYEYNDKGYPLKKIVTNTVSGSSSSSTTSYSYECK